GFTAAANFDDTQTLSHTGTGTGEVVLGGGSSVNVLQPSSSGTLTIGPGILVHGPQGGTVGNASFGLVNQGTIRADTAGKTITVTGTNWSSSGPIEASAGT